LGSIKTKNLIGATGKEVAPIVFYKKICYNIIIRNEEKKKRYLVTEINKTSNFR